MLWLYYVLVLPFVLPLIAVAVRGLHDTGRSGWWHLLLVVPIANIALYVFWALPGEGRENRYDRSPCVGGVITELAARVLRCWDTSSACFVGSGFGHRSAGLAPVLAMRSQRYGDPLPARCSSRTHRTLTGVQIQARSCGQP